MRLAHAVSAPALLQLAACGQAAAPSDADAQPATHRRQPPDATPAEPRRNYRAPLNTPADRRASIPKAKCGEMVTPQFTVADLRTRPAGRVAAARDRQPGPCASSCYGVGHAGHRLHAPKQRRLTGRRSMAKPPAATIVVRPASGSSAREIAEGWPGLTTSRSQIAGTTGTDLRQWQRHRGRIPRSAAAERFITTRRTNRRPCRAAASRRRASVDPPRARRSPLAPRTPRTPLLGNAR